MNANHPYYELEPREVWRHFAELNQIARPSGHEAGARAYVQRVAQDVGATWKTDARGNIVVQVPARGTHSAAHTDAPIVAIQSHLDMVCEKRPNVEHDFFRDPILPRRDGDLIFATGTTLGADNGIGAAMALAVLTSSEISHGPLELLFTVEEETGLYGALELDAALLRSSMLINLDSEDPEELTIGCAGGAGIQFLLDLTTEHSMADWPLHTLNVSGLKGGHSGVQIHEPLANAIKLLCDVLEKCVASNLEMRLVSFSGGTAHNAIPRDATATLAVSPTSFDALQAIVEDARKEIEARWLRDEPGFALELARAQEETTECLTNRATRSVVELLRDLPHGVLAMSETFAGKVETSCNLCSVLVAEGKAKIDVSVRSFRDSEIERVLSELGLLGEGLGASVAVRDGYPGWEPHADSVLLKKTHAAFVRLHGHEPQVQVVHAGLECGVLLRKYPKMEAISFGPLIRGAHTPEESVHIPSVETSWQLLRALLADLSQQSV